MILQDNQLQPFDQQSNLSSSNVITSGGGDIISSTPSSTSGLASNSQLSAESINQQLQNVSQALAAQASEYPSADLVISSVSAPTTINPDSYFNVNYTINNKGNATAAGSYTRFYLSKDQTLDSADITLGYDYVNSLSSGASSSEIGYSLYLSSANNLAAGTYYLITQADGYYNYVAESDENNNLLVSQVSVAAPAKPDLTISSVSAPTTINPDSYFNVNYTINNKGNATAAGSYTRFYLSKDQTLDTADITLGYGYVNSLSSGASSSEIGYSLYLSSANNLAAGTYYLITQADGYYNYVAESDENNNLLVSQVSVAAPAKPDLTISSVSAPTTINPDSYFNVNYTINNKGNATAAGSYTRFYLSKDQTLDTADITLGYDYVNSLSSGASSSEIGYSLYLSSGNNLAAGTYYLITQADGYYNYVAESDENNNLLVSQVSVAAPAKPDLTISSVSAPTTINPDSYFNVNYTINNKGNATAAGSYTRFYLSKDQTLDTADITLGYDYVNSLSSGASSSEIGYSLYLSSGNNLAAGTYYLITQADGYYNYVAESDENNNLLVSQVSVAALAKPDLTISSVSAPTTINPDSYFNVNYTINNKGNATAAGSYTRFYLSKDQTLDTADITLGYDYVNSLSSGASSSEIGYSLYLSSANNLAAGTYYLITQADGYYNYVAESDENNNLLVSQVSVAAPAKPDLTISSVSAPTTINPDSYFNVNYTINNKGNATAAGSYTRFYLSKDQTLDTADITLGYDYVNSLSSGASSSEIGYSLYLSSANNLAAGTYYLITQADGYYNYVAESDENNNLLVSQVSVSGSPKPDLTISSVSAPSTINPDSYFNVNYTINNKGNATAAGSYTRFYLSKDQTLDTADITLGYDYVNSLSSGASSSEIGYSLYLSSANNLAAGTYYLITQADGYYNYVAESDENNNLLVSQVSVAAPAKPDLTISSVSASTTINPDSYFNVNYTINNKGNATAAGSYTRFYLSKDQTLDTADITLGYDYVNSLSSGASSSEIGYSLYLSSANNLAAGTYYLITQADGYYNYVAESDENNNLLVSQVSVATAKPDLTISSLTTPSTISLGGSFSVSYTINNKGSATAAGSDTRFYLSKDQTLDSSDTALGYDSVASLAAGSSSNKAYSLSVSSGLAIGTYYLITQADGYSSVTENDETNNIFVQAITVSNSSSDWYSQNLKDAGVIELTRSLAADGNLSRNDMINIFRNTKDGSVIDANELTDLRTILNNSSRFTLQDYVLNLSNKIANGNVANVNAGFGNLSAGSSDTQMENLIGKWFLGNSRPSLTSSSYSYKAASGSLFQNGVSADDIKQGALGDCYYLATLSSIAQEKPSYIQNMFTDNGDNTFTVRFYNNGVADFVTVDNYLPTNSSGNLVYANSGSSATNSANELWVAFAEKAYAQLAEEGWTRSSSTNSYGAIEGGWMDAVIKQVTGLSTTSQSVSSMSKTQLINLVNSNQILTAGFVSGANYGVVNSHAYTITSYDSTNQTFHLRNPWGYYHADVTWEQLLSLNARIQYSNT
ncbi:CARDB domain-containing protein [Gloeothece verrucosa]|uniref:APHP domain protein n=1 Tax=Gloeothece verrucosa (strain PCC 7822) TaxID=497965 RepID=E0UGX6_GLOV7|nr:CARDB domain-containing protein [Gloeothece verrucosa]ADN14457.1 APHP domain protein [Gloeothece verrucosa PCC 7822]